ncbi:hypothetical protein CDV55_102505 [Aspergillus turcosus]|uniref:tetrahydrofolate synthase n=1 Tax=Aspergillus turcosus TaxID=1245748 RepID=A0A397GF43_9EURO|nr:hypothetical protein CDV55_102505 [Aspergillus turcosus]RLL93606.1 hypothetical protein CFD26_100414 [Aspergillus turcosus]
MVPDKRDKEEECTPEWLTRQGCFVPDERTADTRVAPWGRILFCQGLSLVPDSERQFHRPFASLPYLLVDDDGRNPINEILRLHLACSRGGGSEIGNPYEDLHCGFHVTFYEMIRMDLSHKGWKTGFLYKRQGHPRQYFRQSAFSILTTARDMSNMSESKPERTETAYWTILLLTPSDFFARPLYPSRDIDWAEVGKHCYGRTAEMACIVSGLRQAVERWTDLHEYIDRLPSEGDFMDPQNYARLLFDDNMDERSRRYFWIIRCLDEFNRSIEDNMKQWKLYQAARAPRSQFKDSKKKPKPEALLLKASLGSTVLSILGSRQARTTAQRVRDGLFNASALMESRASTRLGHNVALLTYVSIFYLPLAFCAALWAIPNITDSSTRNAFAAASVAVGFFTYTIVFNLENVVNFLGGKYHAYRSGVVNQMLQDSSPWQESQPSTNRNVSSEWWILLYRMRVLMENLRAFDDAVNSLNVIHVSGTKGKGSTCAFTRSFLRAHSVRTGFPKKIGLYTGPHLQCVRERIQIDDHPVAEELFTPYFFEVWDRLMPNSKDIGLDAGVAKQPRYLQFLALLAFHTFIKEEVDAAIFEVHHGGEYDATNVIRNPVVTGITSLGMDHVAQLGPTMETIAWHKAGIFKPGAPAFSVTQDPGPVEVMRKRALDRGTTLTFVSANECLPTDGRVLSVPVQRLNCSLALELTKAFLRTKAPGHTLSDADIYHGVQSFRLTGRFEIIDEGELRWFVDGAHNILSLEQTAEWFARSANNEQK